LGLVALLSITGCMAGPNEMEYPQGIHFMGWNYDSEYEIVSWSGKGNNPQPCPLVIHLPGGDVDEKKLSDRKALKALGWTETDYGNGWIKMEFRQENLVVSANYERGVFVQAGVNTLTCPEPAADIVSINGQKLTLPVSESDLVRALGKPQAAKQRR
jgi:hypothetical protein